MRLVGLGAFPGVIVAFIGFESAADLAAVRQLRRALFEQEQLRHWGVHENPSGFLGHVTLGYLEGPTTPDFIDGLTALRRELVRENLEIRGAGVFTFPHLSNFIRYA